MDHVEELKITWQTLVRYRDLSLENNDFERVMYFSATIQDIAILIEAAGAELPPIPKSEKAKAADGNETYPV